MMKRQVFLWSCTGFNACLKNTAQSTFNVVFYLSTGSREVGDGYNTGRKEVLVIS